MQNTFGEWQDGKSLETPRQGEWRSTPSNLRWMYDKLLLSDALGYACGPVGEDVHEPGRYIVRPITNINGMGEGASIQWIEQSTDHLPAGYFWCEVFEGEHLTVDYEYGEAIRVVRGLPSEDCERWREWRIVDQPAPKLPNFVQESISCANKCNVEFIGGNIIEIQFRHNTDFRWGNSLSIPVYDRKEIPPKEGEWRYVEDPDGLRIGFFVR